jgi:Protein of unknown function (DUF3000)
VPPSRILTATGPAGQGQGEASPFRAAVASLEDGLALQRQCRPELAFEPEPPPRRLAPYAAAVAATVRPGDDEVGWGRFVLLFDPVGQDGWAGAFRVIAYLRCELDPEIAADPLVGQVGWSWLTEALELRQADYALPSGTVTRVVTESFGQKAGQPVATEFELRASWSPLAAGTTQPELARHVAAWADALCVASGLPPTAPGVAALRKPKARRRP